MICVIILPHVFFLVYNQFDIHLKLFNFTLFTNQPFEHKIETLKDLSSCGAINQNENNENNGNIEQSNSKFF